MTTYKLARDGKLPRKAGGNIVPLPLRRQVFYQCDLAFSIIGFLNWSVFIAHEGISTRESVGTSLSHC